MKYTNCNILGAILITGTLAAVNAISASAQVVESVETAVTSEGTLSEFGPQMLIVKSATATEGVRYTSSETTTYVDEEGQPVSVTTVKSGLPVTVYYTKVGDSLVASKVMVRKVAAGPAGVPGAVQTATMSAGTISEFGTDRILIQTTTSPDPLRYSYSKTTTYVDEAGRPVSIKTVKSGLPVTVYYTKVGDAMVATKVIVRKAAAAPAFSTSAGTIGEYGHDRITVRTTTSPEAVRYSYSKTTTYVDEDGNPVSVTTVKSGLPVTLQYTKVGDALMVSKVIVRKTAGVPPPVQARPPVPTIPVPPPIVETKETTTTTRTVK